VDTSAATQDPNAPLAPVWTPGISPSATALVQSAFANKAFFDTEAKLYSELGATGDYTRLFALYSGLTTLQALATNAQDASISKADLARTAAQFTRGMSELEAFFTQQQFEDIRLAQGDRVDAAQTTLALPAKSEDYLTGLVHRGGLYETVAGLAADAKFTITATSAGGTVRTVNIDLALMGSQTRSLGNVISFINNALSAAGASTRLEAVDQTPKTSAAALAPRRQYALKVDVRAGERVSFEAVGPNPAFYVVGESASGARLIKLEDVGDAVGQPHWLNRPGATVAAIGAHVADGWLGPGAPYGAPGGSYGEQRTHALMSAGANNFEDKLRAAGEAILKLNLGDGRTLSVSTAWRSEDLETWRARSGESSDRAIVDDLAERLTQLLHEQGVAAGVDVWEDNGDLGFRILGAGEISASSLTIGGRATTLTPVDQPGMVGGLRDGVFARRFEADSVAASSDLFIGRQTFVITTANGAQNITIEGGDTGVNAAVLQERLNLKLRQLGIFASASLVDDGGSLTLRLDALHSVTALTATLNGDAATGELVAPGAWANGGLPSAGAGQPFGDAIRTWRAGASPLLTHTGALDIELVVATPSGNRTVNLSISAQDRLDNPDAAPGQWSVVLQARLDAALNAAGVYVAGSSDLTEWSVAEESGQRLLSVSVNGGGLSLSGDAPAFGLGGAHAAERSFTSAQAASGVSDDVTVLLSDQNISITFTTAWGERTVGAVLQPGDPRTLESAALRLNEALSAQGYDLGIAAAALAGGGAGLRVVTGSSHTVRGVGAVSLGGTDYAATLDPIDVASNVDDPVDAARVAERAGRGAAVTETSSATSGFVAPSSNLAAWFPGRAFDVAVGGGTKVATARAVATAADGSVYVLADLSGDSATSAIKGARDVALLKYDSAGKLAFTEMLGASQSASGFALAVSSDGKVAVAGSVEGALSGTSARGGADSFVTMFAADGEELWTARRGSSAKDEALAIAFAPNGGLVVSGRTEGSIGGNAALGATDGYLRAYSAAGAELFTRQFGTSGADTASALLVRDDGAGGMEIFTGGVEDNRGVLRRFIYSSSAGVAAGAVRDIGNFYGGAVSAIVADGSSLYVGGEVGADRLTLGATARGAVAGKDGFVARLDANLTSTALDRASYLGSAQDDAVKSLALVDGVVYASGVTGGVMAGAGGANAKSGFLARLDADGEADWVRTFTSSAGAITVNGLAVDQTGASPLDILGLPRGVVGGTQSAPLVERSALRVGDEFRVGADGQRLTTIRVGANDTLASLVTTINRAIGSAGRAQVVREDGVERIKITARSDAAVRMDAGGVGRDALGALGLSPGIISDNSASGRSSLKTFGLGLVASDLRLDSKEAIARTKAELSAAISIVRQAYETLLNPNAKELTDEEKALEARRAAAGPAPEYYTARLANYQAALARLGGG
ncbi:MAG: hypothetical protein K2X34_07625, partial [Hyphomonadaceae bacterium]|nr:hypothetical protein [Hyphomonadaceae bacterium]